MRWPGVVAGLLVFVSYWSWFAWDLHVRYGPLIVGNARWRREAPLRAAWAEHRQLLAALTDDDRKWLTARGWIPPRNQWEAERQGALFSRDRAHRREFVVHLMVDPGVR